MRSSILVLALACLALGCDDPQSNPVQKGQSYVDQARAISAGDHLQKIALAETMIQTGKLQDAERLLDEIDAKNLSAEAQAKLDDARQKLSDAKAIR